MRKFVAAVVALLVSFSLAAADEFFAVIKKVDGNKLTVSKLQKGEKPGEDTTLTAADNVKVMVVKVVLKGGKKDDAGEPLVGGLKNEMFKGEVRGRIITNAAGAVTEIRVPEFSKKKETDRQEAK